MLGSGIRLIDIGNTCVYLQIFPALSPAALSSHRLLPYGGKREQTRLLNKRSRGKHHLNLTGPGDLSINGEANDRSQLCDVYPTEIFILPLKLHMDLIRIAGKLK